MVYLITLYVDGKSYRFKLLFPPMLGDIILIEGMNIKVNSRSYDISKKNEIIIYGKLLK